MRMMTTRAREVRGGGDEGGGGDGGGGGERGGGGDGGPADKLEPANRHHSSTFSIVYNILIHV